MATPMAQSIFAAPTNRNVHAPSFMFCVAFDRLFLQMHSQPQPCLFVCFRHPRGALWFGVAAVALTHLLCSRAQKPLVEFRAGKMLIRGKMVIPDKRKGKIEINASPDDQLMHFKWKDRSTGQVETVTCSFSFSDAG
jgi:hypothetical protein